MALLGQLKKMNEKQKEQLQGALLEMSKTSKQDLLKKVLTKINANKSEGHSEEDFKPKFLKDVQRLKSDATENVLDS